MNPREIIACVSIGLYALVGLVSLHYYLMMNRKLRSVKLKLVEDDLTRKFNSHSQIFFIVMSMSAWLDIPMYAGCIAQGGPSDCEWDNAEYSIFLALHFVSLCGYFYCLGVPLFLWAEVIADKQDKVKSILFSFSTKWFLYISIGCYSILQLIRLVGLLSTPSSNHTSYQHTQLHAVSSCLESVILVIILAIWLWCGIRLQMHVVEVSFRPEAERKILFVINIVMGAILLSNLLRAIMILSLFLEESFKIHIDYSFLCWVVGTRWVPYVFCSALLIMIMQRSFDTLGPARLIQNGKFGEAEQVEGKKFKASQKQFSTSGGSEPQRMLSNQSSDGRSSLLSRGSFALFVADYDNGHSYASPEGSFSNLADVEGPGTPILSSIQEEDPDDVQASGRSSKMTGRSSSSQTSQTLSTNVSLARGSNSNLNLSVGSGRYSSKSVHETIMSLSSIDAYTDDTFGNESKDAQVRAPLLRRELSVTSDASYRADRKSSV